MHSSEHNNSIVHCKELNSYIVHFSELNNSIAHSSELNNSVAHTSELSNSFRLQWCVILALGHTVLIIRFSLSGYFQFVTSVIFSVSIRFVHLGQFYLHIFNLKKYSAGNSTYRRVRRQEQVKVKVKLSLYTLRRYRVGMGVQLHSFLTSALDGGEWSASGFVSLPESKIPGDLWNSRIVKQWISRCGWKQPWCNGRIHRSLNSIVAQSKKTAHLELMLRLS